jgi:hypothetical protein
MVPASVHARKACPARSPAPWPPAGHTALCPWQAPQPLHAAQCLIAVMVLVAPGRILVLVLELTLFLVRQRVLATETALGLGLRLGLPDLLAPPDLQALALWDLLALAQVDSLALLGLLELSGQLGWSRKLGLGLELAQTVLVAGAAVAVVAVRWPQQQGWLGWLCSLALALPPPPLLAMEVRAATARLTAGRHTPRWRGPAHPRRLLGWQVGLGPPRAPAVACSHHPLTPVRAPLPRRLSRMQKEQLGRGPPV